ncbi:ABC transporter permease subunit [Ornithinibacillus salinisoli]|uniref:ABC transporter permease subunit n=1 Tax=Ornithinibacillus salinisoli TaxID=1848459 RepID=A0ABW4W184_9BACI
MRITFSLVCLFVGIFLLAALPISLQVTDGELTINTQSMIEFAKNYVVGLFHGESFIYEEGKGRSYNILKDLPDYFLTSFQYLLIAGMLTVSIGIVFSTWLSKSKKDWIKDIIGFLGTIPDFILVLILQLSVVSINQAIGFTLISVASLSTESKAFLLPLITMTLVPAIYLIRTLSERTYDVLSEEYILTAKAKGLKKRYIYIHHVIRNVIPYLKADLHKVTSIMMSNLFIVEYLFNIRGVTRILFGSDTAYQYNLAVNTLVSLVLLYLLIYWCIRFMIMVLERVFTHE